MLDDVLGVNIKIIGGIHMKNIVGVSLVVCLAMMLSGCGNSDVVSKLQNENQQLKTENADFKNRLSKYESPTKVASDKKEVASDEQPPVTLNKIEFDNSGVTGVRVVFQNNTPKTIDAIEFVILQFDNFGRPAYRFNDEKYGNVSGKLLMQGNAKPQGTMQAGWTLFNVERTTKGKTVLRQVHFTDGSTWNNLKFDQDVSKEKGSL